MSFRDKLEAKARGDVETAALLAFGGSNSDAYDLIASVPAEGPARLSAWCAFVLQTYGDKLLSSGHCEGYASEAACAQAQVLYELARDWLERARQAAADPGYRLDVRVPQNLPRPMIVPPGGDQLAAMRATLEAIQARAGADVARCGNPPLAARLKPSLDSVATAIDAAAVARSGDTGVRIALGRTLTDGLDRGYAVGQLLAMPSLLATADAAPKPAAAAASHTATLGLFLPGDPGFDPWCLTDPIERSRLEASTSAEGKLDLLWKGDPDPARTLAIQAEISSALEHGSVDYVPPDSAGSLGTISGKCPWPGVLYAKEPVQIGGATLGHGDRFVLAVGGSGPTFRRAIVRMPAGSTFDFSDPSPPPHFDAGIGSVLESLAEIGLDVLSWP